jgi:hypothetical protein
LFWDFGGKITGKVVVTVRVAAEAVGPVGFATVPVEVTSHS